MTCKAFPASGCGSQFIDYIRKCRAILLNIQRLDGRKALVAMRHRGLFAGSDGLEPVDFRALHPSRHRCASKPLCHLIGRFVFVSQATTADSRESARYVVQSKQFPARDFNDPSGTIKHSGCGGTRGVFPGDERAASICGRTSHNTV